MKKIILIIFLATTWLTLSIAESDCIYLGANKYEITEKRLKELAIAESESIFQKQIISNLEKQILFFEKENLKLKEDNQFKTILIIIFSSITIIETTIIIIRLSS